VIVDWIDREADHFDPALIEFAFEPRDHAELGGADRCEILRMREQHAPRIAEPLVEMNRAFGRILGEIRRGRANLLGQQAMRPYDISDNSRSTVASRPCQKPIYPETDCRLGWS
jgi:hypothetical protein